MCFWRGVNDGLSNLKAKSQCLTCMGCTYVVVHHGCHGTIECWTETCDGKPRVIHTETHEVRDISNVYCYWNILLLISGLRYCYWNIFTLSISKVVVVSLRRGHFPSHIAIHNRLQPLLIEWQILSYLLGACVSLLLVHQEHRPVLDPVQWLYLYVGSMSSIPIGVPVKLEITAGQVFLFVKCNICLESVLHMQCNAMYIYTYHLTFRQVIFDVGACKLINYILILAVEWSC